MNNFSTRVIDMINDDFNDDECIDYDDAQIMNEFRDALLRIDDIAIRNRICVNVAKICMNECIHTCDCMNDFNDNDDDEYIALCMIATHMIDVDHVRMFNAIIDNDIELINAMIAHNNNEMM